MHQPAETAILQIYPHLLPICPRSVSQTRPDHRNVPDGQKAAQMPSVGRERIRPGTKDIQPMPKKERIRQLFDNIAPEYDRLNHLLSLDIDKTWRRRAVRQIVDTSAPLNILDVACGTGDFAVAIARKAAEGSHITGLDLSEGMLSIGREKILKAGLASVIGLEQGDSEDIPYGEGCFDRVSAAFGELVILELSVPRNSVMRWLYNLYFLKILPVIGGRVSGDRGAYEYLPASVLNFPGPDRFREMMTGAGFSQVRHKAFTFGICRMYIGIK